MGSSRHKRCGDPSFFRPTEPHFFKIILDRVIDTKKLRIPMKFVMGNSGSLKSKAILQVPSGLVWEVDLLKRNREVWLDKGWQGFSDYHSLSYGDFLLFKYLGNSDFSVVIIDRSASEIRYPIIDSSEVRHDHDKEFEMLTKKDMDDHISVVLGDCSPDEKLSSSLSQSMPQKRGRSCSTENKVGRKRMSGFSLPHLEGNARQARGILPHPAPNPKRREKPSVIHHLPAKKIRTDGGRMNLERQGFRPKQENDKDSDPNLNLGGCLREVEGGGKEPAPHHECRKGSVRIKSFARAEKAKALDRASSFRSENPFFMLVMQPSYINAGSGLPIPSSISAKYLTKSTSDIIFKVSGRESWPGVYVHTKVNQRQTQVRVHRGWKKFVQDNGLNVGDVCVFEMIQGKEITFNVSFFRSSEQRDDGQAAGRNGNRSQKAPLEDALDKVSPAFKSQHPFFLVPMYPSYVNPGYRLLIPMEFARKHLKPGEKKNVTLQVARTKWPVRIIKPFRDQLGFSGEWINFVRGNSLKVGDVCAFELIKSEECVLRVTIFRCSGS